MDLGPAQPVALERVDGGATVRLAIDARPRGMGKVIPFVVIRPLKRQLVTALDNLATLVEE